MKLYLIITMFCHYLNSEKGVVVEDMNAFLSYEKGVKEYCGGGKECYQEELGKYIERKNRAVERLCFLYGFDRFELMGGKDGTQFYQCY